MDSRKIAAPRCRRSLLDTGCLSTQTQLTQYRQVAITQAIHEILCPTAAPVLISYSRLSC